MVSRAAAGAPESRGVVRVRDSFERASMLSALSYVLEQPAAWVALQTIGFWDGTDLSHAISFWLGQGKQSDLERHGRRRRARARRAKRARR